MPTISIEVEKLSLSQLASLLSISQSKISQELLVPPGAIGYIIKFPDLENRTREFLLKELDKQHDLTNK